MAQPNLNPQVGQVLIYNGLMLDKSREYVGVAMSAWLATLSTSPGVLGTWWKTAVCRRTWCDGAALRKRYSSRRGGAPPIRRAHSTWPRGVSGMIDKLIKFACLAAAFYLGMLHEDAHLRSQCEMGIVSFESGAEYGCTPLNFIARMAR